MRAIASIITNWLKTLCNSTTTVPTRTTNILTRPYILATDGGLVIDPTRPDLAFLGSPPDCATVTILCFRNDAITGYTGQTPDDFDGAGITAFQQYGRAIIDTGSTGILDERATHFTDAGDSLLIHPEWAANRHFAAA